MNQTIKHFGYPASLVKEYSSWVILLRPKQVTLGSLVLACKEEAESWSSITQSAFSELTLVTKELESSLEASFGYDRLNYLMLMMVDPHVHFHVIPRYAKPKTFLGTDFPDTKWPSPPDITSFAEMESEIMESIRAELVRCWVSP